MKSFVSLKNRKDFNKVYNSKKSFANKYLIMYIITNDLSISRVGISVSKKVGNSVVRHRVTRLIRESIRLNLNLIENGYDIVIIGRNNAATKNYYEIESALIHLLKMHKIIN